MIVRLIQPEGVRDGVPYRHILAALLAGLEARQALNHPHGFLVEVRVLGACHFDLADGTVSIDYERYDNPALDVVLDRKSVV